jgi:hypothetical protein
MPHNVWGGKDLRGSDEDILAKLGYTPVLKRAWGSFDSNAIAISTNAVAAAVIGETESF